MKPTKDSHQNRKAPNTLDSHPKQSSTLGKERKHVYHADLGLAITKKKKYKKLNVGLGLVTHYIWI